MCSDSDYINFVNLLSILFKIMTHQVNVLFLIDINRNNLMR